MKEAEDLRAELASTRAALEEAVSRQQGAAARKKALEKEVRCVFYAQSALLANLWQRDTRSGFLRLWAATF